MIVQFFSFRFNKVLTSVWKKKKFQATHALKVDIWKRKTFTETISNHCFRYEKLKAWDFEKSNHIQHRGGVKHYKNKKKKKKRKFTIRDQEVAPQTNTHQYIDTYMHRRLLCSVKIYGNIERYYQHTENKQHTDFVCDTPMKVTNASIDSPKIEPNYRHRTIYSWSGIYLFILLLFLSVFSFKIHFESSIEFRRRRSITISHLHCGGCVFFFCVIVQKKKSKIESSKREPKNKAQVTKLYFCNNQHWNSCYFVDTKFSY